MLARTLEGMLADALGPDAAATVDVQRDAFVVTVTAGPDRWVSAYRTATNVVSRRDLSTERFEAARARLVNRMAFVAGAPVREFENEAARLYSAGELDWARPPDGIPESLQTLSVSDLDQYRRRNLVASRAAVAIVGPVDETAATGTAAGLRDGMSREAASPTETGRSAWITGDRLLVTREITNTSLAFAYPLPPERGRTEVAFLAHVIGESLSSDPPDPGVYRAEASVRDGPTGPLLIIEAAVFPEVGSRWETRIATAVRTTQSINPDEDVFFPWQQRRFRSRLMGSDAAPEGLGRRLTADLLRDGAPRDLDRDIRALTAAGLVELANSLGEPRILYFGPDMGDDRDP
jgi:hypothetical protein